MSYNYSKQNTDLHEPADRWWQQVMQNEGVGTDVGGHHQSAAIHLLPQCPDVYGQRSQVATGWDQSISQQDGTAKVQCDKATSSWAERTGETQGSNFTLFFLRLLNDILTVYIPEWTHVITRLQCIVLTRLYSNRF